jgi:Flagellar hook-length control protein FliK
MAVALKDALGNSGLFYESHQAQWVSGERSTAQLLIEPQNQLQNRDTQALAAPPDKAALAFQQDKAAIQPDKAAISIQQDKATPDSGVPMTKELVSMVQQQLHTLETHQLTWTGQIWPGQQMQWEIQGEPEHHKTQADERKWSTEVELALPKLGDVHARLVFSQGGIKLTLHAADASAIALLNQRLPALATTMSIAGIRLNSAVIEKT